MFGDAFGDALQDVFARGLSCEKQYILTIIDKQEANHKAGLIQSQTQVCRLARLTRWSSDMIRKVNNRNSQEVFHVCQSKQPLELDWLTTLNSKIFNIVEYTVCFRMRNRKYCTH